MADSENKSLIESQFHQLILEELGIFAPKDLPKLDLHIKFLESEIQIEPYLSFLEYIHHYTKINPLFKDCKEDEKRGKFKYDEKSYYSIAWIKIKSRWHLLVFGNHKASKQDKSLYVINEEKYRLISCGNEAIERLNFIKSNKKNLI